MRFAVHDHRDSGSHDDEIHIPSPIPELDEAAPQGANDQGQTPTPSQHDEEVVKSEFQVRATWLSE